MCQLVSIAGHARALLHAPSMTSINDEGEPAKPLSCRQRKKLEARQRLEQLVQQETIQQSRLTRSAKRLLDWFLVVTGVIGGIAALWSFFPAFSVSRDPPLDPVKIVTAQFVIRYESPIPVSDVNAICYVDKLLDLKGGGVSTLNAEAGDLIVPRMWQGDEMTVPCAANRIPSHLFGPIVDGDITIRILFRPVLIPRFFNRQWEKDFRFITVKQSDGNLRWIPEPQNYRPNPN
jgi:hypothetical protein